MKKLTSLLRIPKLQVSTEANMFQLESFCYKAAISILCLTSFSCRTRETSSIASIAGNEIVSVGLASNVSIDFDSVLIGADPKEFESKYPDDIIKFRNQEARAILDEILPVVKGSISRFVEIQNDPKYVSFQEAVKKNFKMLDTKSYTHKLLIKKVVLHGVSVLEGRRTLVATYLSNKVYRDKNDVEGPLPSSSGYVTISMDLVDSSIYQEGKVDGILASLNGFRVYLAEQPSKNLPRTASYKAGNFEREAFYLEPGSGNSESLINFFAASIMPKAIDKMSESYGRK